MLGDSRDRHKGFCSWLPLYAGSMEHPHWPAPVASGPVDAVVEVPGSKSMTNRALVLAALSDPQGDPIRVRRALRSRDTTLMATGLTAMGAWVDRGGGEWSVDPGRLAGPASVDVGNAGTVLRFLPPAAALADGEIFFDGDARARERPVGPLLDALRALGATINDNGRGGVPLTVHGRGGLNGGPVTLDASSSSQLVSGLLLAAPRFDKGVEVRHDGPPVPSAPHVAMTVDMLRRVGAEVDTSTPDVWRVAPGPIRVRGFDIEPDLSNAAPFLAAAVATGGSVTIPGWPANTTQPGAALLDCLTKMGARCEFSATGLTVLGTGQVHGIHADLRDSSEILSVLVALAALADGRSRFSGVAHTRMHETDRLAALAREINGLGGDVCETPDGLEIHPRPLHDGVFHTYHDHRLATAAAVLGLAVPGVRVENVATTAKTLPDFVDMWSHMLGGSR